MAQPERGHPQDHEPTSPRKPVVVYDRLTVVNSHTSPEDIRLGLARTAVGEGYVPYYHKYIRTIKAKEARGQTINKQLLGKYADEASQLMYDDSYGRSGRSETICVFDENRRLGTVLAATGRLVLGEEYPTEVMRPLELMELVNPEGGWDAILGNKSLDRVVELGRIVVVNEYRGTIEKNGKAVNQTSEIAHHLIDSPNGVVEVAQDHDREIVLMVAQQKFAKHAKGTQLDFGEGVPIQLLPAARVVKKVFPGYWKDQQDPPMLYAAQVPPKAA